MLKYKNAFAILALQINSNQTLPCRCLYVIFKLFKVMRREKYVLNPQTLQFEKEKKDLKSKLISLIPSAIGVLICSMSLYSVSHYILPTSKEKALENQLSSYQSYFSNLNLELDNVKSSLDNIHQKDQEVHRLVFGMDPIDESIWDGGIGGSENYNYLSLFSETDELIEDANQKLDKLQYKLELQQKSMDTIFSKALAREQKFAAIPSIKPIEEDKLKRKIKYMSGYGYRIHPVLKVKKFHKGIDFTCPKGTPIQATGNGVVKKVKKSRFGYGNVVHIDHGFGYETVYAHMQDIDIKTGEEVTRGQRIGTVGSTGTSTAPHLHYEVRKDGKAVNPIDYCMDGLTVDEYQELVHNASIENVSMD